MLDFLGCESLDQLFDTVAEPLRFNGSLKLDKAYSEPDLLTKMTEISNENHTVDELVCFAGGGAYDHDIPAVTKALASRSEFVTAYTPYQPEVSQGILQALFEFQTFISRITGLDVANSSLYDGATALTEAVNMAASFTKRSVLFISDGINPAWREVLTTFTRGTSLTIVNFPLKDGITDWEASPPGYSESEQPPAGLVVGYPNYLGCLEELSVARKIATSLGAALIVAFDPIAMGILKTPGEWGGDIAVAEGQSLGIPLSFGGPYLGLIACKAQYMRYLPGRIVGQSKDVYGKKAYVTTLRAREQDIRREKASSNICTNQTLMAITAAIQLSWLGTVGFKELALRCAAAAKYTKQLLLNIHGVEPMVSSPTFREFALKVPLDPELLLERLIGEGFLGGIPLGKEGILIALTEKRTRGEIDAFAQAFEKALKR